MTCWHLHCRLPRCKGTGASDPYRIDRCWVTSSTGATVCCIHCPTCRCGHLDIPNIFSLFFHCDFISLWWVGHLVSTVYWTSRLIVALDISSQRCIGRLEMVWTSSMEPKNPINVISQTLLVSLIILSLNHQNHKQWPNGVIFLTSTFVFIW